MKYVVLLCGLLVGCVAPPITITQDGRQMERPDAPSVPRNDRWVIIVYDRESTSVADPVTSESDVEVEDEPKVPVAKGADSACPQFKLPLYGSTPSLPPIDPKRSSDYKYIAELLIDHVEALMQYTADVKRRNVEAYDRYLQACELSVD